MRPEPAGYGTVTDAGTGQAAGTSQTLFYVGHSSKTLHSSEFPSQSAELIERNRAKHKGETAWAPAPLQMGWDGLESSGWSPGKILPLGPMALESTGGARMLTKVEVWQGRLGVQPHQWIGSIFSKEMMHMPAEGRKCSSSSQALAHPVLYLLDFSST